METKYVVIHIAGDDRYIVSGLWDTYENAGGWLDAQLAGGARKLKTICDVSKCKDHEITPLTVSPNSDYIG